MILMFVFRIYVEELYVWFDIKIEEKINNIDMCDYDFELVG